MSTNQPVQLSARVRARLEAAASARGETVQALVGGLVERFLDEVDRRGPDLAEVLRRLRAHEAALRGRGVVALWVFGSVARGAVRPDSDVDLLAEFDPAVRLSLVGLASLRAELSELLGVPADLVEPAALRPTVREAVLREAVRAL